MMASKVYCNTELIVMSKYQMTALSHGFVTDATILIKELGSGLIKFGPGISNFLKLWISTCCSR